MMLVLTMRTYTKIIPTKAKIELRNGQGKNESYRASACPGCNALMGQVFGVQINAERSVISAPRSEQSEILGAQAERGESELTT